MDQTTPYNSAHTASLHVPSKPSRNSPNGILIFVHHSEIIYARARRQANFFHFTLLKFTDCIYDSHYCSSGKSLHHGVSGRTKECGWLRQSSFVQSWLTGPAVIGIPNLILLSNPFIGSKVTVVDNRPSSD